MKYKIIVSFIILTLLGGCVSTPYQSSGFRGGYDDIQLSENKFKVSFSGNNFAGRAKVVDYSLLRSAELCLENNFKYFIIEDRDVSTNTRIVSFPGSLNVAPSIGTVSRPSSTITVICFNNKNKYSEPYKASIVMNSIKNKYDIK